MLWERHYGETLRCQHGPGCGAAGCRIGGRLTTDVLLTGPVTRAWTVLLAVLQRAAARGEEEKREQQVAHGRIEAVAAGRRNHGLPRAGAATGQPLTRRCGACG